ncbi:MAG: hypothetical protein ABSB68_04225 [Acidimicrobiales bacterium]
MRERRQGAGAGLAGTVLAGTVLAGTVLAGTVLAGTVLAGVLAMAPQTTAAASTPSASTLYQEALATTHSWSVHYASSSTQSKVNLVESGDAGPASGTQTVLTGKGSLDDSATIDVIGGITYLKGNAGGLESLAGMSATQAAVAAGQWIEFPTDDAAFSQLVAGVRSQDLVKELALKEPLSLGRPRTIEGTAVDAIQGTQDFGTKTVLHVVLYVRARGTHVPVEEDSLDAQGKPTAAEHVVYSKWGEIVRPEAPQATISIGRISTA